MAEIDINVDQCNLIYSDGIPYFRSAINKFGEGANEAGTSLRFFNYPGIEHYLPQAAKMAARIVTFDLDGEGLIRGEQTFSKKLAQMLCYLASIDSTLNLDDYSDLAYEIGKVKELGIDFSNFDEFDDFNLPWFTLWLEYYDMAASERVKNLGEFMKNGGEITVDELKNKLQLAGYSEDEIARILESLPVSEDGKRVKLTAGGIALISFGLSIMISNQKDIANAFAGHLGDQFFNFTDKPAWLLNGPMVKLFEAMGHDSLFGGACAAFIIGTVLSFSDGGFSFETWLEEAASAMIGTITSNLVVAAAAGGAAVGIGTILGAAVIGVGVTFITSKIFEGIFNMPGGIPREFEHLTEEQKKQIIYQQTGLDIDRLECLATLYKSGVIDDEQFTDLFDVCRNADDMIKSTDCDDPLVVAFFIYSSDPDAFDNADSIWVNGILQRGLSMFQNVDVAEVERYIEMFMGS